MNEKELKCYLRNIGTQLENEQKLLSMLRRKIMPISA